MAYGWNATDYQILNPGINLWVSSDQKAVIGYRDSGIWRIVAGAPICLMENLLEIINEFEKFSEKKVCYFAPGLRLTSLLEPKKHYAKVCIGAQPVWNPKSWPKILASQSSLRAQLNRARHKGISISEMDSENKSHLPELNRCLSEWLKDRPMPAMHFLVEPFILSRLWDRKIFLAFRDKKIVGYLIADPIPMQNGWLIEQIVRGHGAPNGIAELLVDAAFQKAIALKLDYFTLGLSPLSQINSSHLSSFLAAPHPPWLEWTFSHMRSHAKRFYNFQGLEDFKNKFRPDNWEPVYAICNQKSFPPRLLIAIAAVFGGRSPWVFISLALLKALKQEFEWFKKWVKKVYD